MFVYASGELGTYDDTIPIAGAREELHRLQLALHAAEDAKREVARQLAEKEQVGIIQK